MNFDRRLTPARSDLAAAHLKGKVEAARFVEGEAFCVMRGRTGLRTAPGHEAALDSELLFGERFTVYESKDGWAWGQAAADGYVGYVAQAALGAPFENGRRVSALMAPVFPAPDLKTPVRDFLPLNAQVAVMPGAGDYADIGTGFVHRRHLLAQGERDFVAVAEQFLNVPYVWGGKTFAGLDCSGLIQTALAATGAAVPRDTDMQERALEKNVAPGDVQRGDLIFWKGHMGVMLDASRLLHANAFHMMVAVEPLAEAMARIEKACGPVTSIKRL